MFKLNPNGRSHRVRNTQQEYLSSKGKNVVVLEMLCGRKCTEDEAISVEVLTCLSCQKAELKL